MALRTDDNVEPELATLSNDFVTPAIKITDSVYRVNHKDYGDVAIKWAVDPCKKVFLMREAMWLKLNPMPYTPEFVDFMEISQCYLLLTSWIVGEKLSSLIINKRKINPVWINKISQVLSKCHQMKVIHGDVKPDNIVISNNQGYLLDFGSIRYLNSKYMDLQKYSFTPKYAAYAPLTKTGEVTANDDWYALAISVMQSLYLSLAVEGDMKDNVVAAINNKVKLAYQQGMPAKFYMIIKSEYDKVQSILTY